MKLKKNRYFILALLIMLLIILISFYQYYQERFAYADDYYIIKENCYNKQNTEHQYCSNFKNQKQLENYIKNADPKKNYEKYDAITVTCEIVELSFFKNLQLFSPLIIIFVVIGSFHSEFISGSFKNYLSRMNFKDYLKMKAKTILKVAMIMPIALTTIFIISLLITNFNFTIDSETIENAVYNEWKYSHFILYGALVCFIQYFISLVYANLALISCMRNRNPLVAIIMAYIMFIILYLFVYVIVYVFVINSILGIKEMTDYFNLAGYWFFNSLWESIGALIVSVFLQIVFMLILYKTIKSKEKMVLIYEEKVS